MDTYTQTPLSSTGTAPVNADVPPTAAQKSSWHDVITRWEKVVNAWAHNLQLLKSKAEIAKASPELQKEYNATLAQAGAVQQRIDEVNAALGDVVAWLQGKWADIKNVWAYVSGQVSQLFGYHPPQQVQLGELGQLVIISIAVVSAAIAWVGNKSLDTYQMNKKLDTVKSYVDQGYSPQDAAALVNKTTDTGGLFSGLSTTLKWGAGVLFLAGAGYLVYEHYQRQRRA